MLKQVVDRIPDEIPVILDAKRGDIGNTASHYAEALYEKWGASWVTLSPYMGYDSLRPFLEYKEKVPSNFRDTLDKMKLHMIVMAEHVANETIKQGMKDKLHYKEIFLLAKQAVIKYAGTVLFDKQIMKD